MVGRGTGRSRGWKLSLGTKKMREGLTVAAGGEGEAWGGCQNEHQVEGSRVEVQSEPAGRRKRQTLAEKAAWLVQTHLGCVP